MCACCCCVAYLGLLAIRLDRLDAHLQRRVRVEETMQGFCVDLLVLLDSVLLAVDDEADETLLVAIRRLA